MRLCFRSILCVVVVSGLVVAPLTAPVAASDEDVRSQPVEKSAAEDGRDSESATTKKETEETETPSEPVTDPSFNTLEDIYGAPDGVPLLKGQQSPQSPQPPVRWRVTNERPSGRQAR